MKNDCETLLETVPEPVAGNGRVIVAMSGGVDSSVTAAMLQQRGWEPVGVFMRSGFQHSDPQRFSKGCCSVEDAQDARRVCEQLNMPFYAVNFEAEFGRIVEYFVDEYNSGRTPNPCVQCNRWLKFGVLLEYARQLDADKIATGHYARSESLNGRYCLRRGMDASKDQSYVLFPLLQEQLHDAIFPLGNFQKGEIRELARRMDFRVHNKKDSVEICFVPDDNYRLVLQDRSPSQIRPGRFLDTGGSVIGEHEGHQCFTVGQRRGLGQAFGKPMYVKSIHADSNTVVLADDQDLYDTSLRAKDLNWVSIHSSSIQDGYRVAAQIRYNHEPVPARLHWEEAGTLRVEFETPERAITPGQAVVFYEEDLVLGGGWIE